jgi:branched-chain amino acid transport system substrate-binding protein
MRIRGLIISVLCLVFLLLFSTNSIAVFKIGNITSTTGPYASMGIANTEGIVLLVEKINKTGGINGEKIEVVTEDHEGESSKALTIAKKMIYDDKVIAIIGPTTTAGSMAASRICNDARIPQIQLAPRPTNEPVQKYTFQTVPDKTLDAEAIAHFFVEDLSLKNIAILHDTNSYGTTGAESQIKMLQKIGIKPVAVEKFMQADRDTTAVLIKIRNAGADGLIVWGTVNVPAVIARDMKKIGMNIPFIGSSGVLSPKFIELAGEAADGCYTTSALNFGAPLPNEQDLFNLNRAKYNRDPNYFTALGYDAVLLFAKAFEIAKSKDPQKIRDALESIRGLPGSMGIYNMSPTDHTGLSYKDLKIIKIIKGKPISIKQFSDQTPSKVSH